jgi:hypothetical protein
MADLNGYEIHVTDEELPHLEDTWTTVETTSENTTYKFKRESNPSMVFNVSGYISLATWAETRAEAEGLNSALNSTPSGIYTDGFGTEHTVLVDEWSIEPVAATNKYTFEFSFRKVS